MTDISNLHFLAVKGSDVTDELPESELERRLSLYQVFLKLYEQHTSLLDEILQLENIQPSFPEVKSGYIQAVIDGSVVYVTTNLSEGKTQSLRQPQRIWTIGRDRMSGIHVGSLHVSRRHAAIQYIEEQGFYLIDFNSSNGTFMNGERVYQPTKLEDGDRIRLGSLSFSFFINSSSRFLPTVAVELLLQLALQRGDSQVKIPVSQNPDDTASTPCQQNLLGNYEASSNRLSVDQQSEILDNFFRKQVPTNLS
ncbi:MAG: FHA domain-containing protein [Cyanomargarita calcarea GSE-NOS-MK-12-04C]|jgi:pSer/pThr/pTyr-binding forkhead associated (FHA) protein|uniref:FHA domain-containing protein n=1 Tax=Cyanomargarita calcarea GSE-NOS-MK-12-04C TaxID=2839659 RepID=A0A951UUP1_9CYAN|nr:FHA domain-containing protein [Cyanomargarita calcarea GSE-NOS-MK-12-04C]